MSLELFAIGSSGLALVAVVLMVLTRNELNSDPERPNKPAKNSAAYKR